MIKITSTFQLDGSNKAEYNSIVEYFNTHGHTDAGYHIIEEPILNRVTAYKTDEVENI